MGLLIGRAAIGCALAASITLASAPAAAGPPDNTTERRSAARALADKGYEHYRAGRYAEAADTLERAEALFHAPTLAFALGKAYAALGRLRDARREFQRIVEEKLPAAAPADYRRAQESAAVELTALGARIPSLRIELKGALDREVTITIDGAPVTAPAGGVDLDPGKHVVRVSVPGAPAEERAISLAEGARAALSFTLPPPPHVVAPPPPPPPRGPLWPSIVAFGVGGVALGAGIGTGVDAIRRTHALAAQCEGNTCPLRLESQAGPIRAEAAASTATFVIAGAAIAAGVALLVLRPRLGAAPRPTVSIGPGSIELTGRF